MPLQTVDSAREQLGQAARQGCHAIDLPDTRRRLSEIENRGLAATDELPRGEVF